MLDGVTRRRIPLPETGVEIAVLDWGGEGPPALLHHANGFCAALWAPVVTHLRPHFRVFAVDARGHGDSSRPEGREAFAWPILASDLAAVGAELLAGVGAERFALGLGHSFGGTLTLAAASQRDLYDRIVLVDPVLYPSTLPAKQQRGSELSVRARKRRAVWQSRVEAREFFLGKDLFKTWRKEALDLYVAEGLRDRADGSVELKCDPEVESWIFEGPADPANRATSTGPPGLDNEVAAAKLQIPALLIWASQGNFPRVLYEGIASQMRSGRIEDMAAGHLVPMEEPDQVAASVLRFCGRAETESRALP